MQYLVAGILKACTEDEMLRLRNDWNEHLSQPNRKMSLMGLLRDRDGKRRGYLVFIDGESFAEAEEFMRESPFYQNHLYERIEVAQFEAEVGGFA